MVFVLDSQAPLGAPEVAFIETLLKATSSLFFIQTKIDLFRKEQWQAIQKRNQDILRERFQGRLSDLRVWPISSTNLHKAAETGDEDYLRVSRHKELAAALQTFLFRVSGWGRAAEAVVLASDYHDLGHKTLAGRLENVLEESKQKRLESQQRALECRKQFDADWGERGQKRRELLEEFRKVVALGKQSLRQELMPGGEIERRLRSCIEALANMQQAEQFARSLNQEIVSQAGDHWAVVKKDVEAKCLELLGPFATALEGQLIPLSGTLFMEGTKPSLASSTPHGTAEKWIQNLRNAVFAGTAAHFILGPVVAATAPVWLVPAIAILAVGIPTAIVERKNQLRAVQQDLLRQLREVLQTVHNRLLFEVDLKSGRGNPVEECFGSFERAFTEQVSRLSRIRLEETQAEIARLIEEGKLNDAQRQAKAEQLRKDLIEWDSIGQQIEEIKTRLVSLEKSWIVSPTVPV
ncbi:MAG: hypothetical protein ACYC3I_20430 [Gemmataceae bacterium]